MYNQFDFYVVEIRSERKTSIYNAMGGKDSINKNRMSSRRNGFRNGYPVTEHIYVIGHVDMQGRDAQDASAMADRMADEFRDKVDVKVRVRYICRD